jgi:hypothetical protein
MRARQIELGLSAITCDCTGPGWCGPGPSQGGGGDGGQQVIIDNSALERAAKIRADDEERYRNNKAVADAVVQGMQTAASLAVLFFDRPRAIGPVEPPKFEGAQVNLTRRANPRREKAEAAVAAMGKDPSYSASATAARIEPPPAPLDPRTPDKNGGTCMAVKCRSAVGPSRRLLTADDLAEPRRFVDDGCGTEQFVDEECMDARRTAAATPASGTPTDASLSRTEAKRMQKQALAIKPDPASGWKPPKKLYNEAESKAVSKIVTTQTNAVSQQRDRVALLDAKVPDLKAQAAVWKDLHRDADRKVAAAKTPDEKKAKSSILDQIIAEEKKTDALAAKYEAARGKARGELKNAQSALDRLKGDAGKALAGGSAKDFIDKHAGDAPMALEPLPGPGPAEPCAGECKPSVRVWRPSTDEKDFVAEAKRTAGGDTLPYGEAVIKLTWPGGSAEKAADRVGKVRVEPVALRDVLPEKTDKFVLKAELGEASHSVTVTRDELEGYVDAGAKLLAAQGEAALKDGDYAVASARFFESAAWKPSEEAAKGWALAEEKLGGPEAALSAYRTALLRQVREPQTRFLFKKKAIAAAQGLNPAPPAPAQADAMWRIGVQSLKSGDTDNAVLSEEAAISIAPWWGEPYYALASIYEHMSVNKSFSYASAAVENFDLFLLAAPKDPRAAEARAERDRLKELQEMMAP